MASDEYPFSLSLASKRAKSLFSQRAALFQMPLSICESCGVPLHVSDRHTQCASCLGPEHAESALTKGGCLLCDGMPVSTLRSRLVHASSVSDSAHLPSSAPREPRRKKRRDQRLPERGEFSECTPGLSPRASPTPSSPVLFSQSDQRPSSEAAGLVSFGGSADDMDDAVSVAASESELRGPRPPLSVRSF